MAAASKTPAEQRIEDEAAHELAIAHINNTAQLQGVVQDGDSTVEALEAQLKEAKTRRDQYQTLLDAADDKK